MGYKILILGVFLVVVGLVFLLFEKFGFKGLPGDIVIRKDNVTFVFPIMTSLVVSLVLSLLFYFFNKN